MKKNKDIIASKANKVHKELQSFLSENSFASGDLKLDLNYWPADQKSEFYYLLTRKNQIHFRFSLQELSALKEFLNLVNIVE